MEAQHAQRWRLTAFALAAGLLLLGVLYGDTLLSMIRIWRDSETFAHGFLVFPAVAFLIYRSRGRLAALDPRPSLLGVVFLAGAIGLWVVARAGDVQVGEQAAFVGLIVGLVYALCGWGVVRAFAFPLAFMVFAVPFGEIAIPTLMEFTAWFTVKALQLSGILVYREGFMLYIPSGDFEVAKACSGIRYLIASVSLGTLYAYLNFTSNWRRLGFVVFAFVLPIIANGVRAWGIVMMAHLSDMRMAVGVDHLIYGWVFFGVVMLLMFWIGSWFHDQPAPQSSATPIASKPLSRARTLALGSLIALLLVVPPLWVRHAAGTAAPVAEIFLPVAPAGWQRSAPDPGGWRPNYADPGGEAVASYSRSGEPDNAVHVVVLSYFDPQVELINALNSVENRELARLVRSFKLALPGTGGVRLSDLQGSDPRFVAHWFQIGDRVTAGTVAAKAWITLDRISGRPKPRHLVAVTSNGRDAEARVRQFIAAAGGQLVACVAGVGADCAP